MLLITYLTAYFIKAVGGVRARAPNLR